MAQVRLASLEVRLKLKINPLHFLQSPCEESESEAKDKLASLSAKSPCMSSWPSPLLLASHWGEDHSETMIIIQSFIHIMIFLIMTSVTL